MDRTFRTLTAFFALAGFAAVQASPDLSSQADAAQQRGEMFVAGSDGRRFLPAELRFAAKLASPEISKFAAPAVDAIADFSGQLKAQGVSLVLLPVPPKALFAGESLGVSPEQRQQMQAGWKTIMEELAARGVVVEDLSEVFAGAQDDPYCRRDTHWSGRGIALAADVVSSALAKSEGLQVGPVAGLWKMQKIQGDLGGDPEEVSLRFLA